MISALSYFIGAHRRLWLGLLGVMIAAAAAENLAIAALYPLLSTVVGTDQPSSAGLVLDTLMSRVRAVPEEQRLLVAMGLFLVLLPADVGLRLLREWAQASVAAQVTYDTKRRLFMHLIGVPYTYVLRSGAGDLVYRLANAPAFLSLALLLAATLVSLSITGFFTIMLLLTIEWRITLGILLVGLLYVATGRFVARRFSAAAGRERQAALAGELGLAQEFTTGMKDIAVAGSGAEWVRRFLVYSERYARAYVRDLVWAAAPGLAMELVIFGAAALAIVALGLLQPGGVGSLIPLLAVFVYAVRRLLGTLGGISRLYLRLAGLAVDVTMLHAAATENVLPDRRPVAALTEVPVWRSLHVREVRVRYPGREEPALDSVTFDITARATTAIVGPSGAGKSTILLLLLKLLEPDRGSITADDLDLRDLAPAAWRSRVGYVGHELFMHRGTIHENIAFGRDLSRGRVVEAARAAHADEFIDLLPLGFDTPVGDRGSKLSAGQRQRVAIARALVSDPDILLLDEPTSALDTRSEGLVREALSRAAVERTVVIVAHAISSVQTADHIVVVDRGRVVEQGHHDQLIDGNGLYARLASTTAVPRATTG